MKIDRLVFVRPIIQLVKRTFSYRKRLFISCKNDGNTSYIIKMLILQSCSKYNLSRAAIDL